MRSRFSPSCSEWRAGLLPGKPGRKSPGRPQTNGHPQCASQRNQRFLGGALPGSGAPAIFCMLEAGDQVAADGRLLEAVKPTAAGVGPDRRSPGRQQTGTRYCCPLRPPGRTQKSSVSGHRGGAGAGRVLVTAHRHENRTGPHRRHAAVGETEPTPLQQRMDQLGNVLVTGSLILVAIVVISGVRHLWWLGSL
jgi:hypothetical protein